jgi:hypothetical protein
VAGAQDESAVIAWRIRSGSAPNRSAIASNWLEIAQPMWREALAKSLLDSASTGGRGMTWTPSRSNSAAARAVAPLVTPPTIGRSLVNSSRA